ncbi:MAG: putative amino acid/amine transport protein [Blastococcus sp.]|jgi:amino acid transporter|nr:putative amino acid/amine transport protein [Blastococcus sp.]
MTSSEPGLRQGALSGFDSVIMAVAGSAPAYSIAATTAVIIGAVGLASPAALLYSAIPMLGIAWAFNYLGRADVNAGAAYSWVGRALHPALGFFSGWAVVVSATIFMVAGSLPAGQLTLSLFSEDLANNTALATTVGALWFLLMVGLVVAGVTVTAKAQWIMTGLEVTLLVVFAIIGLARLGGDPAGADFSWSWFSLSGFGSLGGFAGGALIAAFYFWGWDVTANLNEETEGRGRRAGLGGLVGVLLVFVLFELFTVLTNMLLTPAEIEGNAGNVLARLGDVILPGPGGKLLIIAVMLSTIATLETTLIQVSRSLFAMGRDNTLPKAFGRVHPIRQTPAFATGVVAVVSLVLFAVSNFLGSVADVLSAAISALGLQISIYYGLAALAVVFAYRRVLFRSVSNLIFIGLWPLLGAVFMFWVLIESLPTLDATTKVVGLGAMALGLIPLVWYWAKGVGYYRTRPLETFDALEEASPAPASATQALLDTPEPV